MPSPGLGKRRKGAALAGESAATSNGAGRAINVRVQRHDLEELHALAAEQGTTASELARERVTLAANATGRAAPITNDYAYLATRYTHEQIEALSQAAGAVELEPTVWLRLVLTPAGDVLLRQLRAARRR